MTAPSTIGTALTVDQLNRRGTPSHEVYTAGFYSSAWDFSVRAILGKSTRCGSDVGEVLATIAGVAPGDADAWFTAWRSLGERIAGIADDCAVRGHRVSAARAYLRAAGYLGVAFNSIDGLSNTDALIPTFHAHRVAWEGFVAHTSWPVERIDIPYEGTSLPGWLFRPDTSELARPTVVIANGSDGTLSGVWCEAGEAALERGYNAVLFDGPGQQSMLFDRDVPFRHDWEHVITPVVDFLTARPDIDAGRLGLYGVSQAGYWVLRAAAFEHRFAAVIADGGVVDVGRGWFEKLPAQVRSRYDDGDKAGFDDLMRAGMNAPGADAVRQVWAFRARPYGVEGYSTVLDEVAKYDLTSVAAQISTPTLIIDVDGEQFFPGQPAEAAGLIGPATRVRFTEAEGASYHCQPLARELTEQRMFDWLAEQLR